MMKSVIRFTVCGKNKFSPSVVVVSLQIKNDMNVGLDVCNNECFVDGRGGADIFE